MASSAIVVLVAAFAIMSGSALSISKYEKVSKCFDGLNGRSQTELCTSLNRSMTEISFTAESIDKDCKEPKNPEKDIEGLGLTRVYCCETAKAKVAQLKERQALCDMDLSVPCWKSLEKVLPHYIDYYTKLGNELCATPFPTPAPATNGTNATNETK